MMFGTEVLCYLWATVVLRLYVGKSSIKLVNIDHPEALVTPTGLEEDLHSQFNEYAKSDSVHTASKLLETSLNCLYTMSVSNIKPLQPYLMWNV